MVTGISLGKRFWMMNTWRASVRKRLKRSTLNFAHTFLTDCYTKRACVFSNNESFIFYCNNPTSFESIFCMKTVKSRLFKKYLKRRKSRARFCLTLAWLNISEKKLLKTTILSVQELIKQEKQLVFGPTLTLILPIFGERKKGKLYILKKVGLSTFKEIL